MDYSEESISGFESRDNSRTRRRGPASNQENMKSNGRTARRGQARSKSRTRNNGYKKPMTLNEAKEKVKLYRKQLSEVNEAHDRLAEEKAEIEDELNNIQERNAFDLEQKDKKINELQRDKMRIQNESSLNQQKVQNLESQIQFKDSQIQMAESGKSALNQQLLTLQQSIKMKDGMLSNQKQEMEMVKSQNTMLTEQCRDQSQQIMTANGQIQRFRSEQTKNHQEIQDLKQSLNEISLKNQSLNNTVDRQLSQIQHLTDSNGKLQNQLDFNQQRMQQMQGEFQRLNQHKEMLENETQHQSQTILEQKQHIQQLEEQCAWFQQKSREDDEKRKRLHNTIQELKGNIRVFCRVRPSLDDQKDGMSCYRFDNEDIEQQSVTLLCPNSVSGISGKINEGKRYNFDFDRVFRPFDAQDIVFEEISQLVQSALDGYKVCIFAYGQTGSGKTYTMEGPSLNRNDDRRGMIPRSVEKIFEHKDTLKAKGWDYQCKASYLEIYNETIRDLLRQPSQGGMSNGSQFGFGNGNFGQTLAETLDIHQKKSSNGKKVEVFVEGLTEIDVRGSSDVYPLLSLASRNRSTSRTDCNERSSRSHSVFQLFLNGENPETGQSTFGVLNLIDLAGSERLKKSNATGQQLKETQNINKSLSCLGDVIAALSSKKSKHIPYRNSKLTYLLMNYFGGDAKTLMFVNLCPEKDRVDESLCSLRFAAKVNDCQIGVAKRTVDR